MEVNNTMVVGGCDGRIASLATAHVAPVSAPTAPTSSLPSLHRLLSTPTEQISAALANLRSLYFSPAPPPLLKKLTISKRNIPKQLTHGSCSVPDSGYASADGEEICQDYQKSKFVSSAWAELEQNRDIQEELELLQADQFERAFAIKWVTGFISRCDMWVDLADGDEDDDEGLVAKGDGDETAVREKLVEEATSILSLFSTDEEQEEFAVTRTFSFPISPGSKEQKVIKVELNDAPLSPQDHTSVGLQSWASSILLSERMTTSPSFFSLCPTRFANHERPLRILELGAGTGLLSIVAAKVLDGVEPTPMIVATDYHLDVLENLKQNVRTNFRRSSIPFDTNPYPINVRWLDWESPRYDAPLDRRFNIILAADVVYHPDHARWIKNCVEKLLQVPGPCGSNGGIEGGVFWMMVPVRSTGRHEGLHASVDALFPNVASQTGGKQELVILEKEEVSKRGGVGRVDERGYVVFKIGWSR